MKRRLLRRAAIVLAALLLVSTIVLPRLGPWLVVDDPIEPADAIIILGGTMYERQLEAVDLHKQGLAPRIYLFREIADWGEVELIARAISYRRIVDMQIDVMQQLGVPRDQIEILDEANSTADEADHVYALVTGRQLSRVIIVTSKQHTRRARLVMNRRLSGTGVKAMVRFTRYDRSDAERWWEDRSTLRFTLFETQRLVAYWIGIAD